MGLIVNQSLHRIAKSVLVLLVMVASACVAHGQPNEFVEDFNDPNLDPVWNQDGDPNGHLGINSGKYNITDAHGVPGTILDRSTGGTSGSFTHEIEVVLDPHLLSGSGGTQSDFKFNSIGLNGVLGVVLNSHGHVRVDHNDYVSGQSDHIAGEHPNNIIIGYADGDTVKFKVVYYDTTDTIDVSYSLNGASEVSVYSGGGIAGQFGDVVTTSVNALVFKFGDAEPDQSLIAIDNWSLTAGTGGTPGDFNSDGYVDGLDFLLWQQNPSVGSLTDWEAGYGGQPLISTAAAVPEPSGILLLIAASAMFGLSRNTW